MTNKILEMILKERAVIDQSSRLIEELRDYFVKSGARNPDDMLIAFQNEVLFKLKSEGVNVSPENIQKFVESPKMYPLVKKFIPEPFDARFQDDIIEKTKELVNAIVNRIIRGR